MSTNKKEIGMGSFVNPEGVLFVVYFSKIIAVLDADGKIVSVNPMYPRYLIEYLIALPTPAQVRMN